MIEVGLGLLALCWCSPSSYGRVSVHLLAFMQVLLVNWAIWLGEWLVGPWVRLFAEDSWGTSLYWCLILGLHLLALINTYWLHDLGIMHRLSMVVIRLVFLSLAYGWPQNHWRLLCAQCRSQATTNATLHNGTTRRIPEVIRLDQEVAHLSIP